MELNYSINMVRNKVDDDGLVSYGIFQPYLVIYGGQFPKLEEHIIPGSEPATFRQQLTTASNGIRSPTERDE